MYPFFLHLIRLLLSKIAYRGIRHELDENESNAEAPPAKEVAAEVAELPAAVDVAVAAAVIVPLEDVEIAPVVAAPDVDQLPILSVGIDGWLIGKKVVKVPTERVYAWRSKSGKPLGALWHWTSTAHGTALTMAKRIVKAPGTSVHLWIEHDGTIYQSAPMTRATGHAGGKTAKRMSDRNGVCVLDSNGTRDANSFLLGIEMVSVGEVRLVMKQSDGSYAKATSDAPSAVYMGWPFGRWVKDHETGKLVIGKGPIVKSDQVKSALDETGLLRHYHDYTPDQIDAMERLCRAWRDKYDWTDEQMSWGHIDSDPTRKSDPGPIMKNKWMPEIFKRMRKDT